MQNYFIIKSHLTQNTSNDLAIAILDCSVSMEMFTIIPELNIFLSKILRSYSNMELLCFSAQHESKRINITENEIKLNRLDIGRGGTFLSPTLINLDRVLEEKLHRFDTISIFFISDGVVNSMDVDICKYRIDQLILKYAGSQTKLNVNLFNYGAAADTAMAVRLGGLSANPVLNKIYRKVEGRYLDGSYGFDDVELLANLENMVV